MWVLCFNLQSMRHLTIQYNENLVVVYQCSCVWACLPMAQVKKPTLLDSGRGRFMNSEKVTFIISMPRSSLTEKYFFVGSITSWKNTVRQKFYHMSMKSPRSSLTEKYFFGGSITSWKNTVRQKFYHMSMKSPLNRCKLTRISFFCSWTIKTSRVKYYHMKI